MGILKPKPATRPPPSVNALREFPYLRIGLYLIAFLALFYLVTLARSASDSGVSVDVIDGIMVASTGSGFRHSLVPSYCLNGRLTAASSGAAAPTSGIEATADSFYVQAHDAVMSHAPHPHYVDIYGVEESRYWGPHLPRWMTSSFCERLESEDAAYASRDRNPSPMIRKRTNAGSGSGKGAALFNVLDVGIAYGTLAVLASYACNNSCALYGLDIIEKILSPTLAEAFDITLDISHVQVYAFPPNVAQPPNKIDVVIMTESLEHLNYNPLSTFERMGREILAPGASIFLSTPNGGLPGYAAYTSWRSMPSPPEPQAPGSSLPAAAKYDGHVYEFGPTEVVEILTEAGYVIDCIDLNRERHGHIVMQARWKGSTAQDWDAFVASSPIYRDGGKVGGAYVPVHARNNAPPYCNYDLGP